jgi:hypothetical protein
MALTKRKQHGPDPDQIYVAIDSFASGTTGADIPRGRRLRGDNPNVQAHPNLFLPDGADDVELQNARNALYPIDAPQFDNPHMPKPLADKDAVVATRSFTSTASTGANEHAMAVVEAGSKWPKNHPVVKSNRKDFKPVK